MHLLLAACHFGTRSRQKHRGVFRQKGQGYVILTQHEGNLTLVVAHYAIAVQV